MSDSTTTPRRGPDIILRSAPPLSATSADTPLAEVAKPPTSASNNEQDQAAGTASEMSPEDQAAARAAKQDGSPAKTEEPAPTEPAVTDSESEEIDLGGGKKAAVPYWMKKEITKSRNKQREAEARVTKAEGSMAELTQQIAELRAKLTPPTPPPAPAEDPRPDRTKFENPETYETELTAWATREGERKVSERLAADKAAADAKAASDAEAGRRTAAEAELARLNAQWADRKAKTAAVHADYTEVAEREDLSISTPMAHAILLAENGPDIAYYLGKNPDEAARIAALAPAGQNVTPQAAIASAVEIGRISRMLTTAPRPARPAAPIEPLGGGNAGASAETAELSMEAWAAKREPEIRAARKPFISVPSRH